MEDKALLQSLIDKEGVFSVKAALLTQLIKAKNALEEALNNDQLTTHEFREEIRDIHKRIVSSIRSIAQIVEEGGQR